MLNCSDVKKMYFNKTAVENISLSLENGRIYAPPQPDLPDIHTADCRQTFFPVPKQKPQIPKGKRVTDNNTS